MSETQMKENVMYDYTTIDYVDPSRTVLPERIGIQIHCTAEPEVKEIDVNITVSENDE